VTRLLGNVSTNGINPSAYAGRVKINISKDLRAVALVAEVPSVLAASPHFPANNVAELIAYVKAHPNAINHASAGAGSYAMIDMLRFAKSAGLDMVHVPYKGAGQFVAGLAADEVQLAFINASTSIPLVKAGRLKALAVTTSKRMAQLPDAPTMAEAGFPNIGIQFVARSVRSQGNPGRGRQCAVRCNSEDACSTCLSRTADEDGHRANAECVTGRGRHVRPAGSNQMGSNRQGVPYLDRLRFAFESLS
jgi:Tripartite tricarboxylate transporter family receptor